MPARDIKFDLEAKESLLKGINILGDSVSATFGPKGNCVVIGNINDAPRITKDGVSVAKEVELEDFFENTGAQIIREAALKTLSSVGDSTTTSVILAQKLINRLYKELKDCKDPVYLKHRLIEAKNCALEYIKSHIIPIKDEDIINIASISANNDRELGLLISDAFKKIGRDGVITVESSSSIHTKSEVINGMQFDKGYMSPHFCTDYIKDKCELDNPYVLITEHKINSMRDIAYILNYVITVGKPILIIAEDYDDEVIETLKLNKLSGKLQVCAIKAPSYGEYRKLLLEALAILTDGFNVSYDSGLELKDAKETVLGKCGKIIVNKTSTTILNGSGSKENIDTRAESIRETIKRLESDPAMDGSFTIKFNKERLAKLTGGICVIYVGGTTEIEMQERKDRVDDAVAATKAAIEEGVVLGGGLTYYNAALSFESRNVVDNILKEAIMSPIELLIESCGEDANKILKSVTETIGYDANNEKLVDMYEAGIIDPAKASIVALENAVSVACLFLSSQVVIVPKVINQF